MIVQEASKIWDEWEKGQEYLTSSGIRKQIEEGIDFYEGRQWAKPTTKTKDVPRPIFNITHMVCNNKISAILSTPVRIVFNAHDDDLGTKYTRFSEYMQKERNQEGADKKAVKNASIGKCGIWHYYWDNDARGMDGIQDGALRVEIIDAVNFVPANPRECDEQKQKYIIIGTRVDLETAKSMASTESAKALITPDDGEVGDNTDLKENNLVTVLTKYYRVDGEVYWIKSTKTTLLTEPHALAPDLASAKKELGIKEDAPNSTLPDEEDENVIPKQARATLYPVVLWQFEERKNDIYGISQAEGVTANNKIINFLAAMHTLNVQEGAWGKYIVTPEALRGQKITNAPQQVLINWDKTNPNAIHKMTEQPIQTAALTLMDKIAELTRAVTGSTEVMTGEALGKNQSGAAIAQLQMTAQQPIEELRSRYWLAKRKQGMVEDQFYKTFYSNVKFTYEEDVESKDKFDALGQPIMVKEKVEDVFNSSEFQGVSFDVVIEAMAGTKATAVSDIAMLEGLRQSGELTAEQMVELYPDSAISNKEKILETLRDKSKNYILQIQQLSQQLEQAQQQLQQQDDTVRKAVGIIQENKRLNALLVQLQAEATEKIEVANQVIKERTAMAEVLGEDAQMFAGELAKNGIVGKRA